MGNTNLLKNDKVWLSVIFLIVHLTLLYTTGIYAKEESTKYIREAQYFVEYGNFTEPKYIFYSGYVFLRILNNFFGWGDIGVYICQLIFNAIATICFYKLSFTVTSKKNAAILATLILIACIPYQRWTTFLFTESFFFSLLIIYSYVIFAPSFKPVKKMVFVCFLLPLIIISRPTGVLMIPTTLILFSYQLLKNNKRFIALGLWIFLGALFILLIDAAMQGGGGFDFIKPFAEEHIICGLAQKNGAIYEQKNSLKYLLQYVGGNFSQFSRLAVQKIFAFFGLTRHYYSAVHNFLLVIAFYPLYVFAIAGIIKLYRKERLFITYAFAMIGIFALSVALSCDDWHNRFIMPIMPLIFIFAAAGIISIIKKVKIKYLVRKERAY